MTVTALPRTGVAGVTRLSEHAELFGAALAPASSVQGALALAPDPVPPALHLPSAPGLRLVGGSPSAVKAWTARFAQALVEVVAGDRNPHQLLRCTSPDTYARISERSAVLNSVAPPHRRRRRLRAQVRSVHCFQPTPTTAEASVHVRHGDRSRALAIRVELREGRWMCVAVEFG